MIRWPWKQTVTDADREASSAALVEAHRRKPRVDRVHAEVRDIIERNHLGEKIHRALGGAS